MAIPGVRLLEAEEPMSTSLPQMLPDVLPVNPLLANVMAAGLSGSQPNLNGGGGGASTSGTVPQRSTSETILSISRTNVRFYSENIPVNNREFFSQVSSMTDEELEKLPVKNLKVCFFACSKINLQLNSFFEHTKMGLN
jgi:hypothetical protein